MAAKKSTTRNMDVQAPVEKAATKRATENKAASKKTASKQAPAKKAGRLSCIDAAQ